MDKEGNEIETFSSIKEAFTKLGINTSAISKACKGKLKSTGGFKWKYVSNSAGQRLTTEEVQEIKELHQEGVRVKELAAQYNKSVSSIQRVLSGRSFAK